MEWCVDTRIPGAVESAETEISAHLVRHSLEPAAVDIIRPAIRRMLEEAPSGLSWLTLDWEGPRPLLDLQRIPDGPLPGEPIAPGVSRCHDLMAVSVPSRGNGTAGLELAVNRAPEGDLDPLPLDNGGIIPGVPLSVAGVIAGEVAGGRTLEEAAAIAGATMAELVVANAGRDASDPTTVAELFIEAEHQVGADFRLVTADDHRAVLANRRCPFGPSARPAMCRFTSALAGGLGVRLAGGTEVTLDERLAMGDHQCRLILNLKPPATRPTSHHYSWPPAGLPSVEVDEPALMPRGFRVNLSLQLPRDRLSVSVTRHLISAALVEVGVLPDDVHDVELALSEACANVINHSGPGDAYEVAVTVAPNACHIRVVDVGRGFDHESLSPAMAGIDKEHGRGVALMHALVDQVRFESKPEQGTVVHLVKTLHFDDNVPARKLMLESL